MATFLKNLSPAKLKALKMTGYGLGGAALAAGENEWLLNDFLSPELKKINLGIGAGTGLAAALGGRKALVGGLLSLPLKQLGLLGIGSLERSREQERELMGLQLERALTDLNAARSNERAADNSVKDRALRNTLLTTGALSAAGLAGAGGYYAYNQRKKPRKPRGSNKTLVGESGQPSRSRDKFRIRIDVPARSAPEELLKSLVDLDEAEKAHTQLKHMKAAYHRIFAQ